MAGRIPYGCGQCLACRIQRRRIWQWRQYLESLCHDENTFVTLTYDQEHLPADGSLCPEHLRLFLHSLRSRLRPLGVKVRYFGVGEYGEETIRPHYHLSLFGVGVVHSALVDASWGRGFVQVAEFNETTAQYVAGYVVKKLSDFRSGSLSGLFPEFARMSLRPGIGAPAMRIVAESLQSSDGKLYLRSQGDVPYRLKIGKRHFPLGRYLRQVLRKEVGLTDEEVQKVKDKFSLEKSMEMWALLEASDTAETITQAYQESIVQKVRNMEARSKVYKQRRTL